MHNFVKVGAPAGGRVHNVLHALPKEFKQAYDLEFNYNYKSYFFSRCAGYLKRDLIDCFIVHRTSKHCFRASYYNSQFKYFKFFSSRTADGIAKLMNNIYKVFKEIEQ